MSNYNPQDNPNAGLGYKVIKTADIDPDNNYTWVKDVGTDITRDAKESMPWKCINHDQLDELGIPKDRIHLDQQTNGFAEICKNSPYCQGWMTFQEFVTDTTGKVFRCLAGGLRIQTTYERYPCGKEYKSRHRGQLPLERNL